MPAALKYLKPGDKDRLPSDMVGVTSVERKFKEKYETARAYYDGDMDQQLNVDEDGVDDNVIMNLVKMSADRTISFLFPQMPKLILDANRTDNTPDEQWLEDCWAHNGGLSLLLKVGLSGYLAGHNFILVQPPREVGGFPRAILLDPARVVAYWHASDIEQIIFYEISWDVGSSKFILDVVNVPTQTVKQPVAGNVDHAILNDSDRYTVERLDNGDGTFTDQVFETYEIPEHWELIQYTGRDYSAMDEVDRATWNSPYSPIVQWQHLPKPNSFYGSSEFTNKGMQDNTNRTLSTINRILRFHGSPKTIGTGFDADDVQETSIDGFWAIENSDARVQNLEMQSEMIAAMSHLQYGVDAWFFENRVVVPKGDVKDFQRVTNAGIRAVFMDPLSKNTVLRNQYHPAIVNISHRFSLAAGKPEMVPDVIGADPLPSDELEMLQVMATEDQLGITSQQQMAQQRNKDWNTIKAQRKAEIDEGLRLPPNQPKQSTNTDLTNTDQTV